MSRRRNFCITYNNYDSATIGKFKNLDCIKYAVFGKEVGEKGTPHLQGYVQLHNAKTIAAFQKVLKINDLHCSVIVARGNWQQNVTYCAKDDNVTEWGKPKKQGNRTDLQEFYKDIKAGKDDVYLQENHTTAYIKYYKAADRIRKNLKQYESVESLKKEYETVRLRFWQQEVLQSLKSQNSRQVDWVVDPVGNRGKTWLAKYLITHNDAFYVQGGKTQDISYAFNYQDTIVFDFTRSQRDFVNYSVIESFKNGLIFSPKYESCTKKFAQCKVLCLSNWSPDLDKLSQDRWKIWNI